MTLDIARERLSNQRIDPPAADDPAAIVRTLGAVQAQDYAAGLWALGLRTADGTAAMVERAIADGAIVRTWPMRGTLHFVAPEDVRWMLRLLASRIIDRNAGRLLRRSGIDEAVLRTGRNAAVAALEGGRHLSRTAMYQALEAAGIETTGQRGLYILWVLAQEGLLCVGPRQGKQQVFALLDEWVPQSRTLEGEDALAELALRYFTGHGPATLQDFVWWSGLPITSARVGLEMARTQLTHESVGDGTYWFSPHEAAVEGALARAHLLPVYDEYMVGYRDRGAALDPADARRTGNGIFRPIILIDGRVAGTWRHNRATGSVTITTEPFSTLSGAQAQALEQAVERYGRFLGLPVVLR